MSIGVVGRPTVMTLELVEKLEAGFLQGLTDREACLLVDIDPQTLYNYCTAHPDFSSRKELLKEQVKLRAKQNIAKGIHEGDKPLSQWYVERRDKDFKQKTDITSDDKPIPILAHVISEHNSNSQDRGSGQENTGS